MSNASYSVVPQGSTYITSFDPDVIANRGYMTTEEIHYMVDSIAGASRRVDVNRADMNSLHVAAGRNTGDGDVEDPDSDSDSSGDEDEIPYHAARILMVRSGVPPSRIEANIEFLRLYNSLSPSEQDVIRAKLAADVDADEPSTSLSTAESTHSTADLVFRHEDTKVVSLEDYHDIPRAIINLAKLKMHVPLTLLTFDSMKKVHAGDDISSFPPEDTLSLIEFYQASDNFIKLMSLVADPVIVERFKQHRSFCLSHMERYRTVLAFDMETRRIFFNTESFLAQDAYLRRWHAMDLDMMDVEVRQAVGEVAAAVGESAKSGHSHHHGHRFHPYSKSGGNACLCLICGRTGHKASGCTNAYTVNGDAVVCEWDGTLVLKSTLEVVCISFNIGRCAQDHERVHVCSICGSQGHDANRCC